MCDDAATSLVLEDAAEMHPAATVERTVNLTMKQTDKLKHPVNLPERRDDGSCFSDSNELVIPKD